MNAPSFFEDLERFHHVIAQTVVWDGAGQPLDTEQAMEAALALLLHVKDAQNAAFVIGSGGSAAIASHVINDLINACGVRAIALTDPAVLTCMTNDYGYDQAYSKLLETHSQKGDVLIAISSSGGSPAIHNAVRMHRKKGGDCITLSGFSAENPLRGLGHLNIWVPGTSFGVVEMGHAWILHHLTDRLSQLLGRTVQGPLALRKEMQH
ncbi:MAG: SIS domain-containing protein, partial [Acidobacteria bacterium]|nr:SIS domain-containing protein [Acidobacteriota bacterium]